MMELFDQDNNPNHNILPYGGAVYYYGKLFSTIDADNFFQTLLNELAWQQDQAIIFGKHIYTKRKVAWYADQPFTYTYSGIQKTATPWHPLLLQIKTYVEAETKETFNSCLCNLYHNGAEGMAWHSDGEKDLKKHGAIASVTLGAQRKFGFKHKQTKETHYIYLEHGSLLIMKDDTQDNWLHRLPPSSKVSLPRINLTFRKIDKSS